MAKTAQGLVDWGVLHLGWAYMYGVNGKIITEALIQQKAAQYPRIYTSAYITKLRRLIGRWAIDCSGLIDVYLGVDKSAAGYYAAASPRGPIKTLPAGVPGLLIFKRDIDGDIVHVGICDGLGKAIEARGVDYGVVRATIAGAGWDYWGYCHLIDYTTQEEDNEMLFKGDKDETVRAMQRGLIALGYDLGDYADDHGQPTGADSEYGSLTADAVADFKAKHNIEGDGLSCDMATLAEILEAVAARPSGITQAQLDAAVQAAAAAANAQAAEAAQQAQAAQAAADKATARLTEVGQALTVLRAAAL